MDFTVAIITYNGATRIGQVLDRLETQIGLERISWEILVVDNNSSDRTAEFVREYQEKWLGKISLRYVFEGEQGESFARNRAIQEAKSELVGFLDDDNLPERNWVAAAYQFAQDYPQAGAFGSQIHGLFEKEPSQELQKIIFYLAITERGNQPLRYEPKTKGVPPSAGLVVRRPVWVQSVPQRLLFTGRKGKSLVGSEDAEALLNIHNQGWEIWYNPAMEIQHVIPAWRLERDYLIRLMRGIGLSRYHLRMLQLHFWQRPLASIFYLLNDARKLIIYWLRHHNQIQENIITACEIERLWGSFLSPLYTWKMYILNYFKIYQ